KAPFQVSDSLLKTLFTSLLVITGPVPVTSLRSPRGFSEWVGRHKTGHDQEWMQEKAVLKDQRIRFS
ncbi:MAG: hypothetical protein ACJ8DF_08370, partial [Microvirga sp.]